MKKILEDQTFDRCIETSDWRWSAAVLGVYRYLTYHKLPCEIKSDTLYYNQSDLTEQRYLAFVEAYYGDQLHHIAVQNKLKEANYTESIIKEVNERLKGNKVMEKAIGKLKFNGENSEEILNCIEGNKESIIRETFRNKNDMYKQYCNVNTLLTEKNSTCRLVGYSIDFGKKGKAVSYGFDTSNFVYEDEVEFDYIPFAFYGERETFFINANTSIELLDKVAKTYRTQIDSKKGSDEKLDAKKILFQGIMDLEKFIFFDVEIIMKSQDKDYYETLFIHNEQIQILKRMKDYFQAFCFSYKLADKHWLAIHEEVIKCVLNHIRTDKLIELFLKNEQFYVVDKLIRVNVLIENGGIEMEQRTKGAYACAKKVVAVLEDNKLKGYREKLTSAIISHDQDRVCEILLQLSNYSGVSFDFAFDLFADFEGNKDVAYSFIGALNNYKKKDK